MRFIATSILTLATAVAGFSTQTAPLAGQRAVPGAPVGGPQFSTAGGGFIVSDDFNSCAGIDPIWTANDPQGDSVFRLAGVGSGDAYLEIEIPAGSEHQSFGSLSAPYLTQAVANSDFEVEIAIETLPSDGQLIGLMVLQDTGRWMRFDLYGLGGSVFLYSGVTKNGNTSNRANVAVSSAPGQARMRLRRQGSNWNCDIATGGGAFQTLANYNFNLSVGQVGPYAGNFGSNPAHLARFDYAFDTAFPVTAEDAATGGGASTLTVQTTGSGQVQLTPPGGSYDCGTLVTLTAVPDPTFVFEGWSGALSGTQLTETIVVAGDLTVGATFGDGASEPPADPILSGIVSSAAARSALISWTTDIASDSRVDYGLTTAYGDNEQSAAQVLSHSLSIDGLEPETTYHFEVSSTTPEGGAASSGDFVFTTLAEGGLATDDFNSCGGALQPFWVLADSAGDGMVALTGGGTDDALLNISVPGGSQHRAWNTLGVPYLHQSIPDDDFTMRTRLEFAPGNNQTAGFLVVQDDANWIRFDLTGNNGNLQAYAAVTGGGQTSGKTNQTITGGEPIWMQVTRTNNKFRWWVSYDGVNYNLLKAFGRTLSVASVGLYGGNSGSNPAYTAQFDYFESSTQPIGIEDGPVGGSGDPHTLDVTISGGGTVSRSPDQPTYSCSEVVTLTAVPASGQLFDGWTGDLVSSANPITIQVSADRAVTATFLPDGGGAGDPPVITGVSVNAGIDMAQVMWTTDILSDSRADWSISGVPAGTVSSPAFVLDHDLVLQGLTPQTTYDLTLQSATPTGQQSEATGLTFTTGGGGGSNTFASDDFQTCSGLGAPWSFTNSPAGDGSASLEQASGDAILRIEVPAGVERQAYGSISAPYVTQSVDDEDLELEAKFLTRPQAGFAIQGLLALGNNGRWVRFDTYGTGSTTRWYVGRTVNGSTIQVGEGPLPAVGEPLWVQVARQGDTWTYRYSTNGVNFTELTSFSFAMELDSIGPYAGSASGSSSPGFVSQVDYVFDTADPIVPEDGSGGGSYTLDVTVMGGTGTVTRSPDLATYACGDIVTLTALPTGGSTFESWSGDVNGTANPLAIAINANTQIEANFSTVGSGLEISNLTVNPLVDSAVVTWTTNEAATSRVDYGATTAYGNFEQSGSATTSHSLTVTGLSPGTTYQFQASSTSSTTVASPNSTFTTLPPTAVTSDDFNGANLDLSLWNFTDPSGLAELRMTGSGTQDAGVEIEIPSGAFYTPFGTNQSARISQPVADTDLSVTVRFESEIASINSSTGVFFEADENNWVRFDFYFDGQDLNLFSSSFTNGNAGDLRNTVVQAGSWPAGSPLFLRVSRGGVIWSADYSFDGVNFLTGNSFFQSVAIQRAGIFCGNDSSNPLGHTVRADWFFDTAAPIVAEDAVPGVDNQIPFLYSASATVLGPNAAEVRWRTDELTTGSLVWGLDTNYTGGSASSPTLAYEHSVLVTGLTGGSTYHFQASASDASGNSADSADTTFDTPGTPAFGEPDVDFWYGLPDPITGTNIQRFGHLGDTQSQLNVIGRVTDGDEDRVALTVTLEYRLNGGPLIGAAMGDDRTINYEPWRLADEGDFNIELYPSELINVPLTNGVHRNVLELVASDDDGNVTIRPCFVDYSPGLDWEANPVVDWSDVLNNQGGDVTAATQVVDGLWNVETVPGLGTVLRTDPAHQGYDRIVTFGESEGSGAWSNYEALVPVTVIALDPQGFTTGTGSHAMGFIMRWGGHTLNGPYPQPLHGLYPIGALWLYRWFPTNERWQLWINENEQILNLPGNDILVGTTYLYRMRCETQLGGGTFYGIKLWEQGTTEPASWTFTHTTNPGDPLTGSFGIFGHHADIAIGDVQVTQLP